MKFRPVEEVGCTGNRAGEEGASDLQGFVSDLGTGGVGLAATSPRIRCGTEPDWPQPNHKELPGPEEIVNGFCPARFWMFVALGSTGTAIGDMQFPGRLLPGPSGPPTRTIVVPNEHLEFSETNPVGVVDGMNHGRIGVHVGVEPLAPVLPQILCASAVQRQRCPTRWCNTWRRFPEMRSGNHSPQSASGRRHGAGIPLFPTMAGVPLTDKNRCFAGCSHTQYPWISQQRRFIFTEHVGNRPPRPEKRPPCCLTDRPELCSRDQQYCLWGRPEKA